MEIDKNLMKLVRNSYPGDSIKDCITEDGELIPYRENVGDLLAEFVAEEVSIASSPGDAIAFMRNAITDLNNVVEALECERTWRESMEYAAKNMENAKAELEAALRVRQG